MYIMTKKRTRKKNQKRTRKMRVLLKRHHKKLKAHGRQFRRSFRKRQRRLNLRFKTLRGGAAAAVRKAKVQHKKAVVAQAKANKKQVVANKAHKKAVKAIKDTQKKEVQAKKATRKTKHKVKDDKKAKKKLKSAVVKSHTVGVRTKTLASKAVGTAPPAEVKAVAKHKKVVKKTSQAVTHAKKDEKKKKHELKKANSKAIVSVKSATQKQNVATKASKDALKKQDAAQKAKGKVKPGHPGKKAPSSAKSAPVVPVCSPYDIVKIPCGKALTKAYRKLALKCSPDRHPQNARGMTALNANYQKQEKWCEDGGKGKRPGKYLDKKWDEQIKKRTAIVVKKKQDAAQKSKGKVKPGQPGKKAPVVPVCSPYDIVKIPCGPALTTAYKKLARTCSPSRYPQNARGMTALNVNYQKQKKWCEKGGKGKRPTKDIDKDWDKQRKKQKAEVRKKQSHVDEKKKDIKKAKGKAGKDKKEADKKTDKAKKDKAKGDKKVKETGKKAKQAGIKVKKTGATLGKMQKAKQAATAKGKAAQAAAKKAAQTATAKGKAAQKAAATKLAAAKKAATTKGKKASAQAATKLAAAKKAGAAKIATAKKAGAEKMAAQKAAAAKKTKEMKEKAHKTAAAAAVQAKKAKEVKAIADKKATAAKKQQAAATVALKQKEKAAETKGTGNIKKIQKLEADLKKANAQLATAKQAAAAGKSQKVSLQLSPVDKATLMKKATDVQKKAAGGDKLPESDRTVYFKIILPTQGGIVRGSGGLPAAGQIASTKSAVSPQSGGRRSRRRHRRHRKKSSRRRRR